MPEATLPTSPAGWAVALASSFVGFLAGWAFLLLMNRLAK